MRSFVLDQHLSSKLLAAALRGRSFTVFTLQELGLASQPDPEVMEQTEKLVSAPWVLVTMDLTMFEDHSWFDWSPYSIAWIDVPPRPSGHHYEGAKQNALHNHAVAISEQARGDHFTYGPRRRFKRPPSQRTRPY